jgi:hypothetical protein
LCASCEPDLVWSALFDKGSSLKQRKISLIGRNDLDENGIRYEAVIGPLARVVECRSGGDDALLIRGKRNPARLKGLQ